MTLVAHLWYAREPGVACVATMPGPPPALVSAPVASGDGLRRAYPSITVKGPAVHAVTMSSCSSSEMHHMA
jgi:hypothetical protein